MESVPAARLTLLTTHADVDAGILTWLAWQRIREADSTVLGHRVPGRWIQAFAYAGVDVVPVDLGDAEDQADQLLRLANSGRRVVWFCAPGSEEEVAHEVLRSVGSLGAEHGFKVEIEKVQGNGFTPGGPASELVGLLDTLRSPGGCPWTLERTHESLAPFAVEEAHELVDAIERGDREHLREELGDLLLQVVFHCRVAEDHPTDPFSIEDVAHVAAQKMRRRHPHVYGDASAATADEVRTLYLAAKEQEKSRTSLLDGVPISLPALTRAAKVLERVDEAGLTDALIVALRANRDEPTSTADPNTQAVGRALLTVVAQARSHDVDAEAALRAEVREVETLIREIEGGGAGNARGPMLPTQRTGPDPESS